MQKRIVAASAALILGPLSASVFAAIAVEQIEAYDPGNTSDYAPVNFNGNPSVLEGPYDFGGAFPNLTFYAVGSSNISSSHSDHAYAVGELFYGIQSVALPYANNIYCDAYDDFFNNVVTAQSPGVGPLPGNFSTGVKVVNNSYIADYGNTSIDSDAIARVDYMIAHDNVTLVAGAVTSTGSGNNYLPWSSFNALAVAGNGNGQSFSPTGGPGKQHGDLYLPGDASFTAAAVSGFAMGLYGNANASSQTDAMNDVVNRSLLMAGADKTDYVRNTTNNLATYSGAGDPNYDTSLAILQSGEKSLLTVGSGSAITGTPATTQEGWSYGNVSAGTQSVVLFSSTNTITGLTASLNWDVTSNTSGGYIDTSSGGLIFPNLTLEVRAVTYNSSSGKWVLGSNMSNTMLHSYTTAANVDNVQYLYDTTALSAGNYAFLIGGDSALTPKVGFSYTLAGSFISQWNNSTGGSWATASNWTNGMPDGRGAQANLLSSPGITSPATLTLDGDRTVGQLTFNNSNGYTIINGSGGTLIIDDTGDSSGTANPLINVLSGNQVITALLSMANGLTITVANGSTLNLANNSSGSGTLLKNGSGTLILAGSDSSSAFDLNAGITTITSAGTLTSGTTYVSNSILSFAANPTTGILVRNVPVQLDLQSGGIISLNISSGSANRQLLQAAGGISFSGTSGAWVGKLDLNNNDVDIPGGSLATITNQIAEGYNNGKWNGSAGVISSTAAANTAHLTALGVIQNNQSGSAPYNATNTFDTTTPGVTDILIKYTYYGDANLDGKVDGSDYSLIDNGYLFHLTGWYNGDFNYDGVVNGSDYTLIDNAFNTQGAVLSAIVASPDAIATAEIAGVAQASAVPEPTDGVLMLIPSIALISRRRSRLFACSK